MYTSVGEPPRDCWDDAGIGCADHTPSMLDVLLFVVHRNHCLYLRGRAPEVYLAAYLRCH